jgi:hypothetical protein
MEKGAKNKEKSLGKRDWIMQQVGVLQPLMLYISEISMGKF